MINFIILYQLHGVLSSTTSFQASNNAFRCLVKLIDIIIIDSMYETLRMTTTTSRKLK